ncbi:MAG: anaerobic sulfite reductase subunit AsrB [Lachnospiraceae bacterium]|jgi:anaerobic sulfite reductase subunit B|nr:anaerobic sulfite reductase subunit AsrB [Lachnospiraceae bacterium]
MNTAVTNANPYIPFPSEILDVVKHTQKEYTFRMKFEGEVRPGQFFEVSVPKFGEAPISVSGIGKDYVDLTIRRVGRVTNEVFEHYKGQSLLLRGPYGNGFDIDLYKEGETVVVAGGTGVSPVRGVIEALSTMDNAKDKYAIAGFRSPDDMLFRDDLARWKDRLNLILTVDRAPEGYEGNVGLVTKFIADLPLRDPSSAKAVVVGPPPMMKFTIIELQKKGFKDENITVSYERKMCCGLGKCGHCRVNSTYICLDGPVFNYTEGKLLMD